MKSITLDIRSVADRLGVLAASLCAVHCLALPAFLVVGATVPTIFFTDESFHQAMVWVVIPCAVVAFALGCRKHRDRTVLLLGVLGVAGLLFSGTVVHDIFGETAEKLATVGFAGLTIAAHVRNFKLCRSESCCFDAA